MKDTKDRILLTALRLFARDGYEAVSVSDIAGELGITKGALYRHYRNKRDVLDSILARMEELDAARAGEYGLPEGTAEEMPEAYSGASVDRMVDYAKSQFRYWTEDDFAASFRRLLTLEQYRNREMGKLCQQYLISGPVGYMADLFAAAGLPRPMEEAVGFYAPMFFLYGVHDGAEDRAAVLSLLDCLMENARARLKKLMNEVKS